MAKHRPPIYPVGWHTHATLLIANATDLRTVSGRLGHARTSTTGDIYSHFIKSADRTAAETMDNIIKTTEKNL
ncbi:MAG: hypothetical protein RR992_02130 [Clostridiales bacterium]